VESALAWIGAVVEWIGRFVPRREILDTTEGAVKYKGGSTPVYCGPGIHWWWPWKSKWQAFPIVRQPLDLRTQIITTTDDKTVAMGGLIVYEILDLLKLVPMTYHPDMAVKEMAVSAIHSVCAEMDWETLKRENHRGTLDTKLRREAQKALAGYGVKVIQVTLTDLSLCRVFKVINSTSMDEAIGGI
jgi:hypothetical protein